MSGHEGMHKNVELVRTLRETVGDDYDIMLDCWQSFDPIYTIELADRIASSARAGWRNASCPIASTATAASRSTRRYRCRAPSTKYTRWGFKRFIDAEALDVLQPDIYWAGGLSEVMKDRRLRLGSRPHGDSARPFHAGRAAFLAGSVAAAHAAAGVSW